MRVSAKNMEGGRLWAGLTIPTDVREARRLGVGYRVGMDDMHEVRLRVATLIAGLLRMLPPHECAALLPPLGPEHGSGRLSAWASPIPDFGDMVGLKRLYRAAVERIRRADMPEADK